MAEVLKILVIDDDAGIGHMMQMVLEFSGYEVSVTEKPNEAEQLISEKEADLVILDMLISGVNGIDVCKRIRKNEDPAIAKVPILMMSALYNAGVKCKKAGANDFIAKPFEMDELTQRVEGLMKD
ncbi:hypothetical protein GCM10023115_38900 [Pontixanthobacter gangjinensis]|uniref:Response regulator n=1 Tax=Christiangramia aestuarii TaxID=1028746 RepID=A0A7M3SWJ3_9FLAO|nr:response regulator transcription factor [Christiangramia aestuarii]MUP40974.1 response regulator [Christiangramia aestuarii]